jgi:5-methylcytosine-specific restriction endonuclease McrA
LESRVSNLLTWVARLRRLARIATLSQELVRFDTQLLQNAEISGVEYQRGELAGYEVREYVLEKWGRECAYCHRTGVPLELDHIVPRSRRGTSHRVSNLAPACRPCNQEKGDRTAEEFGHPEVQAKARQPLQDAAAVNASRWALFHRLVATGLPVEVGTGGRTKWNRTVRGLLKAHWSDAACVGASTPEQLKLAGVVPLQITAMGRHSRQMRHTNAFGVPDKAPKAMSCVAGMRTGDIVRAVVPPPSVKAGVYVGRLAVRASGSCNIKTRGGTVQGIPIRYCQPLQRGDGYTYHYGDTYQKGEAARPLPA